MPLLTLDEALFLLAQAIPARSTAAIHADRDDPAMDLSIMDGAALRSGDGRFPRRILGTLFAGDDPRVFHLEPGDCVRIMTGAALPAGADAVTPLEELEEVSGRLVPQIEPRTLDWVRRRGGQAKAGDILLPEGTSPNAVRVGLRAQVGELEPPLQRIKVGIAASGDELVEDPQPFQVRDSNGPMLAALAHALGADVIRLPRVPDTPEAIADCLGRLGSIQILLTTGGVSMGEKDFWPQTLQQLGARILFHRIRLKPGKPMLAAILSRVVVLCLPGNPVSAYLNARLFLPAAMARLEGRPLPDPWRKGHLITAVTNPGDRPLLQPCRRHGDELVPLDSKGSADLVRLAQADVCAWIPAGGMETGQTRYLELI